MTPEEAIEILWEYHHVKQELRPADLCSEAGSPLALFRRDGAFYRGMGRAGSGTLC